MGIANAILALLSSGPRSGYDLKKLFLESESLHWSGNNNQIYAALVQLHNDGLVSREVHQPERGPARKEYALTAAGRETLHRWLTSAPELPQFRSPLLARLMAAATLADGELQELLAAYAGELRLKLLALVELRRRSAELPDGSLRRRRIRRAIQDHAIAHYEAEQRWLLGLEAALAQEAGSAGS